MKKVVFQAALVAAALVAGQALIAGQARAADEDRFSLTASLGVVSEYYFRGISQAYSKDDIKPAIQPGLEGEMKITDYASGYLGVWGSNVDFNNGTDAEADLYGGFRFSFGDAGLDLGMIHYHYLDQPDASHLSFNEFKAVASYDFGFAAPSLGYYYSPDYFGASGNASYVTAGVSVPLPVTDFSPEIRANVGHQAIEKNATWGTKDYMDWNIGIFATFFDFTVGLQYVDNNLKKADAANTGCRSTGDPCSAAAVLSVAYSYSF
ncbi:TorF family putative porin [Ferrovibrio sp.]|uniref:TorF family putative porin n=1 Tax=Ferrovibrio sp. TaxID=1917215 RepID=UPI00311E5C48